MYSQTKIAIPIFESKIDAVIEVANDCIKKGADILEFRIDALENPNIREIKKVIEEINSLKPNILIVAMGAPKQEKWIYTNKDRLQVDIACGQGGTLDYEAGNIKRAPEFFQRVGLEWLWRLIKQPSRIVRMAVLPKFLIKILFTKDISKGKFN